MIESDLGSVLRTRFVLGVLAISLLLLSVTAVILVWRCIRARQGAYDIEDIMKAATADDSPRRAPTPLTIVVQTASTTLDVVSLNQIWDDTFQAIEQMQAPVSSHVDIAATEKRAQEQAQFHDMEAYAEVFEEELMSKPDDDS